MAPSITPLTTGQPGYTVQDSKAFIAGFDLDINATETKSFSVTYPDPLAGLSVSLVHINTAPSPPVRTVVALPAGGSVAHYDVQATVGEPTGGTVQLAVNITETGGGSVNNEAWELRATATSPALWVLDIPDSFNLVVDWLACDPVAALTVPATAFEQQPVTLNAGNAAFQTSLGTLPTGLAPRYTWQHTGALPLTELPATTAGATFPITPPGVYEPVPISLTVSTTFADPAGIYTNFLRNTSAPAALTVSQRPQRIVLVIDRSGSMSAESRYDNAKAACRVLVHLFAGLRESVNAADRVAIVAFEDEIAGFRAGNPSARIQALLPLSPLTEAVAAIDDPGFDFGVPGTNTPIGDGLVAAIDLLAAGGPLVDQRFTIILLTDGQENAGHVALVPASAQNGAISFAQAVGPAQPLRRAVLDPSRCRAFTIALGPTADQNVLHQLALSIGAGEFALPISPSDLAESFGHMLESSQTVNALTNQTSPTNGVVDPDAASFPAGANAVYLSTEASADRLVLSVVPPPGTTIFTGTIQLAAFDGASYVPLSPPPTILSTESDRSVSVSKLPTVGAGDPIHWRVIHGSGPATAQPLAVNQVLSYVDLHLRADIVLDRPAYRTGDTMTLTARIRHDDEQVVGAKIRATLVAPDAGLGEVLSALSEQLPGIGDQPDTGKGRDEPDASTWMERRIGAMLRHHRWHDLPCSTPSGIFVDGTDELFDPEGDGNYINTFARVDKEGAYRWQLFAEGLDANGQPFTRTLAITTFASIKVDTRATRIKVVRIHNHPSRMLAARVTITPKDKKGERLGPNKDDQVIWALRDGVFEHVFQKVPAPVFADGTYQRVVLFQNRQRPSLQVKAAKVLLPEIDVKRQLAGLDLAD